MYFDVYICICMNCLLNALILVQRYKIQYIYSLWPVCIWSIFVQIPACQYIQYLQNVLCIQIFKYADMYGYVGICGLCLNTYCTCNCHCVCIFVYIDVCKGTNME